MKRVKSEEFGPIPVPEVDYEPITRSSLVKQLTKLENLIVLNQEQRRDNPKNPEKFLQSEADLHELLNWFNGIGTADSDVLLALASDQLSSGFYSILIPLLEHPNTDIGNKIVEIIHEIFHDEEGFNDQEDLEIISQLAHKCLKADLALYFVNHARKLRKNSEDDPDDNQAIFQIFQVFEDILELYHQIGRDESRVVEFYEHLNTSGFVLFLIEMFKQDSKLVKTESWSVQLSPGDYANRLYAAELCATIFQLSAIDLKHETNPKLSQVVNNLWKSSLDILIESILVSISPYRHRDPIDSDEQEYLFNLFDCLAALLLNSSDARNTFNNEKCEGFQLFILFLREVNVARIRAIQIIDYALAPEDTFNLATNFINIGGLKVVSPILMGKGTTKLVKNYPKLLLSIDQDESHVCAIVASLFKNIPTNSSVYFRLITKFIENSGEKFIKLIEFHQKYSQKLANFDKEHGIIVDDNNDEWLLDRINAGLFILQQIDICLLVLHNSLQVLQLIGNNSEAQAQIEKELFDAVWDAASTNIFNLDENILQQVKQNVREFIKELDGKTTIPIVPLLKSFQ